MAAMKFLNLSVDVSDHVFQRALFNSTVEGENSGDLHKLFHCLWNDHGRSATMRNATLFLVAQT